MCVKFGKDVLIADDLSQITGPNLTEAPRVSSRVHGTTRKEGRNRWVLPVVRGISGVILLLAALLFFLEALSSIHDAGGDAAKGAPDHGARPERSSSVFSGECHQSVTASLSACHGIGKTENVCNRVARNGVTEAQWPR